MLPAADASAGRALVERYLELRAEDARRAFDRHRRDSVRMFKEMFGVP